MFKDINCILPEGLAEQGDPTGNGTQGLRAENPDMLNGDHGARGRPAEFGGDGDRDERYRTCSKVNNGFATNGSLTNAGDQGAGTAGRADA
jgi:hypothetical protein